MLDILKKEFDTALALSGELLVFVGIECSRNSENIV